MGNVVEKDLRDNSANSKLRAWPVCEERGVIGVISLQKLKRLNNDGLGSSRLSEFAVAGNFPHVHSDHPLHLALDRMGSSQLDLLPVVSRADVHHLEGVVTLRDVLALYGVGPKQSEQPQLRVQSRKSRQGYPTPGGFGQGARNALILKGLTKWIVQKSVPANESTGVSTPEELNPHLARLLQRRWLGSDADRLKFSDSTKELGYELLPTSGMDEQEPRVYGLQIRRRDRVDQESIDNAVLEMLRFAKAVDGEYDGWETELVRPSSLLKSILKKVGLG